MAALFGIHIGNTSACLAIWKDEDRVEVVANDAGERVTPTVVQWTPDNCIAGRAAQLEHFKNESNTVVRNKQLLNSNISEIELEDLRSHVPYKINKFEGCIKYELLYEGKQHHVLPRDILLIIMKKIHAIAKAAVGGSKELSAVVAVPLHFTKNTISLIKDVVKKVGFNVLQLIDEPSSAALGAGLANSIEELPYHCLIYRIGGVTLDATVLLVQDGMFTVVSSIHKYDIGGTLFTEKLADFLKQEFQRQYKSAELTERSNYKLYAAAENVKQILSIQNVAQCSAESVGGGFDLNCSVSRARFENMISSHLSDLILPVRNVLDKSGLSVDKIKKAVLCGGSLKIPKLQEAMQNLLTSAEIITSSCPDELISIGAAVEAGYCMKYQIVPEDHSICAPCLSSYLTVKVRSGEKESSSYVVPENSALPLKKHYEFNGVEKSTSISVDLVKNEVTNIGTVELDDLEGVPSISIDLEINRDGKLLLTVDNKSSCKKNCIRYELSRQEPL